MIVPMKKVHIITQEHDVSKTLDELRNLGVLHVEHQKDLEGGRLLELTNNIETLKQVIDVLDPIKFSGEQKSCDDWNYKANEVLDVRQLADQHQDRVNKRIPRIEQWEPWGDFEPDDIRYLKEKGIYIQFYEIPDSVKIDVPKGVVLEKIFTKDKVSRYIAVLQENTTLPYDWIMYPPVSLKILKQLQTEEQTEINIAERIISEHVEFLGEFKAQLMKAQDALQFEEAALGIDHQEKLAVLKGYCPVHYADDIQKQAREKQWACFIEDPTEDDDVPTLLHNPKWVEMIKPIFGMINIVPGYKEMDISLFFLLFFTLFVGFLIGDAGYGMVYGLFFLILQLKMGKKLGMTFFLLMYSLCASTIIYGVLTGTYFGQAWLPAKVGPLVPWLRDNVNVQMLCFFIGAIHLSIAHVWRAIIKFPHASFLADAGWMIIIWGMYFLANTLVLSTEFPVFGKLFFIIGAALIILFTKPNLNILKAIGPGIGDFLLNIINAFTDVVSYIRLFAVGLATVAVADAANNMSLFWVIFLHTLNVLLAAMAILVHGLRLNVLEFSGHLSMEWSGYSYYPFKKLSNSKS